MPKLEGGDATRLLKKRIGAHIRAARERVGLSQTELAVRLDVTSSTVCDWENGRTYPALENLRKIARITKTRISFLASDALGRSDSLEALALELGVRLGYKRLVALSHLPDSRLRKEIDAAVGAYFSDTGFLPSKPQIRGRSAK